MPCPQAETQDRRSPPGSAQTVPDEGVAAGGDARGNGDADDGARQADIGKAPRPQHAHAYGARTREKRAGQGKGRAGGGLKQQHKGEPAAADQIHQDQCGDKRMASARGEARPWKMARPDDDGDRDQHGADEQGRREEPRVVGRIRTSDDHDVGRVDEKRREERGERGIRMTSRPKAPPSLLMRISPAPSTSPACRKAPSTTSPCGAMALPWNCSALPGQVARQSTGDGHAACHGAEQVNLAEKPQLGYVNTDHIKVSLISTRGHGATPSTLA